MTWPTYLDEDGTERCAKCSHACGLHERICFDWTAGADKCTCQAELPCVGRRMGPQLVEEPTR